METSSLHNIRYGIYPQVKEILAQALNEYRIQKEILILEQIKEAIESLHNSASPITQRAISRSRGISEAVFYYYPKIRGTMLRVIEFGQEQKEKQNSPIMAQSQQNAGKERRLHKEQADLFAQELLAMVEETIECLLTDGFADS